jgi:hypothetical protein
MMLQKNIGRILCIFGFADARPVARDSGNGVWPNKFREDGDQFLKDVHESRLRSVGDSVCGAAPAVNQGDFFISQSMTLFTQRNGKFGPIAEHKVAARRLSILRYRISSIQ